MTEYRQQNLQLGIAFITGTLTGILGGLVGLGGAEFRLPVLLSAFGLQTITAVVINLAVSLVTVISSIIFRAGVIPYNSLLAQLPIILNLLIGTIAGSYFGVSFATRLHERTLQKIIAILLIGIGLLLLGHDVLFSFGTRLDPATVLRFALGILLGFGIGLCSSLLGIAGGELIIPTLILVFSMDPKLAGSVSLVISVPTIVIGLVRYHRKGATEAVRRYRPIIVMMAIGSILGSFLGSLLLGIVSDELLRVVLALILFLSAGRMLLQTRHNPRPG